jgi:hypothetical protein
MRLDVQRRTRESASRAVWRPIFIAAQKPLIGASPSRSLKTQNSKLKTQNLNLYRRSALTRILICRPSSQRTPNISTVAWSARFPKLYLLMPR